MIGMGKRGIFLFIFVFDLDLFLPREDPSDSRKSQTQNASSMEKCVQGQKSSRAFYDQCASQNVMRPSSGSVLCPVTFSDKRPHACRRRQ